MLTASTRFYRNFSLSALLAILEPGTGKILRPQAHKKRPHLWVVVNSSIISVITSRLSVPWNGIKPHKRLSLSFYDKRIVLHSWVWAREQTRTFYVLLVFGIFWWNFSYSFVVGGIVGSFIHKFVSVLFVNELNRWFLTIFLLKLALLSVLAREKWILLFRQNIWRENQARQPGKPLKWSKTGGSWCHFTTPAIWFSLDHKLYASGYDYDSDSVASENQPLVKSVYILKPNF